ncbi:MAG: DUF2029 domain-containing protein [Thermoleophilia bacterium]|nr:DUF2029 domain-containing protein [Thermoleophilia bacterium]
MSVVPGTRPVATQLSPAAPRAPEDAMPRGWRGAWTPARARLWLLAAAIAAWLPLLGVPLRGWLDFSAFYAAGRLAFTPAVTGLDPVTAFQAAHGLPITPFVYPAGMALPYAVLASLPYGLAAAVHALLMAAFLGIAAVVGAGLVGLSRRWVFLGALAWAPAAAGVASGQNTSAALLLVALSATALVSRRDLLGGALAGILAYKPQLAAPLVGLLLLRGRWRALGAAAAVVAIHWALGVVATGGRLDWPRDWLATVAAYQGPDQAANGWQAISLPGVAARVGAGLGAPWLAWVGHVAAAAIILACVPALRRAPWPEAVALATTLGLLISPHAWVYDAALLLPALAVLAARATRRGWPWRDRWWFAAAYLLGLAWPLGGVVGVTAMPLVVLAMPLALLERGPFRSPPSLDDGRQAPVAMPAADVRSVEHGSVSDSVAR